MPDNGEGNGSDGGIPEDVLQVGRYPRETLDVEMKAWISPAEPEGEAKIAKALLALRNQNGGYLVVGVEDGTATTSSYTLTDSVQTLFNTDKVQAIATKFASTPFEVETFRVSRSGGECIVIKVPAGVRTPVAAKRDLVRADGVKLISKDAVYVRTLGSNHAVSSSLARADDWEDVVARCAENREADIGRFVRRHLTGMGLEDLVASLALASKKALEGPPVAQKALDVLQNQSTRFLQGIGGRIRRQLPGTFEIALASSIDGTDAPDRQWFDRLMASNLHLSGWPAWAAGNNLSEQNRPYFADNGWEAIVVMEDLLKSIDAWRIEPTGRLYLATALDDDLQGDDAPKRRPTLDFARPILWMTEVLATGFSFLRAMNIPNEAEIGIAVQWLGLRDRELASWAQPSRRIWAGRWSRTHQVTANARVTLGEGPGAIRTLTESLLAPLFMVFDGMRFETVVYDELVAGRLSRRF